jgi:hypothetical protein
VIVRAGGDAYGKALQRVIDAPSFTQETGINVEVTTIAPAS